MSGDVDYEVPFATEAHRLCHHNELDHVQARLAWEAMAFKMYVGVTHIAPAPMTDEEVDFHRRQAHCAALSIG